MLRPQEILAEDQSDNPAGYRVFNPDPPYTWVGFCITPDCARRLLHEGKVELVRTGKRIRGVRPVVHKREPVKVVEIRGASIGKPKLEGFSWMQAQLPRWCWHEIFYAVLNSVRSKPFLPWTWEEIQAAAKATKKPRRKPPARAITPIEVRLRPPLCNRPPDFNSATAAIYPSRKTFQSGIS